MVCQKFTWLLCYINLGHLGCPLGCGETREFHKEDLGQVGLWSWGPDFLQSDVPPDLQIAGIPKVENGSQPKGGSLWENEGQVVPRK